MTLSLMMNDCLTSARTKRGIPSITGSSPQVTWKQSYPPQPLSSVLRKSWSRQAGPGGALRRPRALAAAVSKTHTCITDLLGYLRPLGDTLGGGSLHAHELFAACDANYPAVYDHHGGGAPLCHFDANSS